MNIDFSHFNIRHQASVMYIRIEKYRRRRIYDIRDYEINEIIEKHVRKTVEEYQIAVVNSSNIKIMKFNFVMDYIAASYFQICETIKAGMMTNWERLSML